MRELVVGVAFALGGCALLVSTSDLSGGASPADAGGGDAATSPTDAGGDATDAGIADALAPSEAGRFCEGRDAAFCADFDQGAYATGWGGAVQSGGTFELVTDAKSAPYALRSSTPAVPTSGADARLWWQTTVPAHVNVAFDARLDAPTTGDYEFLKVEFPTKYETDDKTYLSGAIEVAIAQGALQVVCEGWDAAGARYHVVYPPKSAAPAGTWTHLELDATLSAAGTLRLTFDGAAAVDLQGVQTLPDSATAMRIVVGTYANKTSTPLSVGVDDVVVTLP